MKIGNLKLKGNVFLAPMHSITINAFRLLCKDYGASFAYQPIMNENALLNNYKNVLDVIDEERPIGGQIIGKDSLKISKSAKLIEPFFDIIDLNLGCPRMREVNEGVGAVLLRKPEKVKKLVSSLVKSVSKPVSVKIRLGFKDVNVLTIAKIIEEAGADVIIIHARTAKQDYSVPADWLWIKKVKEVVNIPVIGNGDIFNPFDAKKMLETTKCDGIMIARGANGNPFIFRDIKMYLEEGILPSYPSKNEKLNAFFKFLEYYEKYVKNQSINEIRTHAFWFTKGLPNSKKLRSSLLKAKSKKQIIDLLGNY